jgi:hypothetical protein
LKYRNTGANERRELLVEEKKIVGFDTQLTARTSESRQRADTRSLRRRNVEDAKTLAFEARSRFVNAGGFDGARHAPRLPAFLVCK